MIGRRSTKRMAECAVAMFAQAKGIDRGNWIPWDPVHDYFFERDFDAKFLKVVELAASRGERPFIEFFLGLHTGETVPGAVGLSADALQAAGQLYLQSIAQEFLKHEEGLRLIPAATNDRTRDAITAAQLRVMRAKWLPPIEALRSALELDGYAFRDGALYFRESSPVPAEKHRDLLVKLAQDLGLGEVSVFTHCLQVSEDRYQSQAWEDCVGNARKAMELAFFQCASLWSRRSAGANLPSDFEKRPVKVREYFKDQGLISEKEHEALSKNYALLSEVGSHPYIAQADQARMLRQIALVLTEFVMVRTSGALKATGK